MIEITVNRDGTVSTPSGNVFLGNKFENLDETLGFTFPEEFQEYNKYLIGYHKRRKATVILPINNNIFYVTTGLTYLDGDWTLYAMCRQQVLDLSTDEQVDISPKEGEHVFISDGFSATVASNNIDLSVINSTVLDQNLQPIYEELLRLKDELKNDEVIKIELSDEQIQSEVSEQAIGRPEDSINIIEYKDVYINRNLFLNSDGTTKKTIYLAISNGDYETPNIYCINNSYKDDQIVNYSGSYMMQGQPELLGKSFGVASILIDENTTQKDGNHFRIVLSQRINLLAGTNLDGFVRSIVDYDEGYTVPVAVDFDGYMFVPTYPTLEKEWTLIDTFTYNQEDFADSSPVINKQYSGLDYTEICIVNDMKYTILTEEQSGVRKQDFVLDMIPVLVLVNDKMVSALPLAPGGVCHLKYNGIYWQEKSHTVTYLDIQMYTRESTINVDTFNVGKCNKLSLKTNLDEVSTFVVTAAGVTIESITFKIYAR